MIKKIFKNLIFFILLIFSTGFFISCSSNTITKEPLSKSEILMGTSVTITIYDSDDEKVLDKVFTKIKELEKILSINVEGTLIDEINENAGVKPVKVDDDTYTLIKKAIEYSNLSNGLFDISIGPIVKLWSIGLPDAKVPSDEEIKEKLPLVGYNNIEINDTDKTVFLKKSGMMIDLGGIAKGYTADVISSMLTNEGVESAIINLGGNVFTHGKKIDGSDWKIGIQNPFSERGDIIGTITTSNKSVVTSGIYERYIEENSIKYHHILSPKTGYPYDNEIAGITIISDTSTDGDALSTSVFAMGVSNGLRFINSLKNIDAIFITKDNKVYITDGIKNVFNLSNSDFILSN